METPGPAHARGTPIHTLVLSSGGVRGYAHVGAVHELVRLRIINLRHIKVFIGSSIGALIGCLLACGMTADELVDCALELDVGSIVRPSLLNLAFNFGLDDQSGFRTWLSRLIGQSLGNEKATFRDLQQQRGVTLRLVVTNVSNCSAAYLDADTHPDLDLVSAVCMSTCLPVLFQPIKWQGSTWMDGALCDSFPMCHKEGTLGLKLRWTAATLDTFGDFFARVAYCALKDGSRDNETSGVIPVQVGNVSTTRIDLPLETRHRLIDDGKNSVARWYLHL